MISRQEAIDLYGGSAIKLAKALGYTSRHAVYMWPKDCIPREPYLRLRYELRPEAFNTSGAIVKGRPAAQLRSKTRHP